MPYLNSSSGLTSEETNYGLGGGIWDTYLNSWMGLSMLPIEYLSSHFYDKSVGLNNLWTEKDGKFTYSRDFNRLAEEMRNQDSPVSRGRIKEDTAKHRNLVKRTLRDISVNPDSVQGFDKTKRRIAKRLELNKSLQGLKNINTLSRLGTLLGTSSLIGHGISYALQLDPLQGSQESDRAFELNLEQSLNTTRGFFRSARTASSTSYHLDLIKRSGLYDNKPFVGNEAMYLNRTMNL